MPLGTTTGTATPAPKGASSAPVSVIPFTRAATEHVEDFLDITLTPGGNNQPIGPIDIPAYGFMRGIFVEVTCTGGTGTAAVAKADAPFSAVTDIQIQDVNGAPMFGPFDGHDVLLVDKYSGIRKLQDPRLHPDFQAVQTSGNFSFLLYIPVEVNGRDALGALGNMNAASAYKLRLSVATQAAIYSANPTTQGNVRVRAWLDAWSQPPATSLEGQAQATEPPAHGTTSYWSKQTFNVNVGQQQLKLSRVGNYIRELIIVTRDTTNTRTTTVMPAPLLINWDTRLLKSYQPIVWRGLMGSKFNYTGANDAARGLDTGVFVEDYCHEFDGDAGYELRDGWLPTVQSTRLELSGSFLAQGTVTVLVNDVSPNGDVFVN